MDETFKEERFQISPESWMSFARYYGPNLVDRGVVDKVESLAAENGFKLDSVGDWTIYTRDANILNFYQDDTPVHSALGVYRRDSSGAVLLRASETPFSLDDVVKDLKYFQRTRINPPIFSINSASDGVAIKKSLVAGIVGIAAGIGIVLGVDSSAEIATYVIGAEAGAGIGAVGTFMGYATQLRGRKSVTNPNEYFLNDNARRILKHEQAHIAKVDLQYALFEAMGGGSVISPEKFLEGVYNNLPRNLLDGSLRARADNAEDPAFGKLTQIATVMNS